MIELGSKRPEDLFLEINESGIKISGPHQYFWGYKIGNDDRRNGLFVEWKCNDHTAILMNDRYGMLPFYSYYDGKNLGFSSSISKLVEKYAAYELDYPALSVFFGLGSFIADSTPFQKVKRVKPYATYVFNSQGLSVQCGHIEAAPLKLSREEAKEKYAGLLQSAVAKCNSLHNMTIAAPLSGGRDTRHILFSLMREGIIPDLCLTVKDSSQQKNQDPEIAEYICKKLGLKHVVVHHENSILKPEILKNNLTGFCTFEHAWLLKMGEYINDNSVDFIFDGIAGDVLSNGLFLTQKKLDLYQSERYDDLAEEVMGPGVYLTKMLKNSWRSLINSESAKSLLIGELKKYSACLDPVGQFYFWTRTRRNIALSPFQVLAKNNYVFAPYLDADVFDFLISLPVEYYLGSTFHTETISKAFPEYAGIGYATADYTQRPSKRIIYNNIIEHTYHLRWSIFNKQSPVRSSFLLPRILKGLLRPSYGMNILGIQNKVVYLQDLLFLAGKPYKG